MWLCTCSYKVGKTHSQINTQERARQFQELFTAPDEYFDRHCKQILSAFGTMKTADKRQEYIECFSIEKWKKLSQHSKKAPTLATCLECALTHAALQQVFPGPTFQPVPSFTTGIHSLSQDVSSSKLTHHILSELQPVYEATYGASFTRSLCECKGSKLQQKPTKVGE